MSKSLGNTISPQEIWNSRGADVLRAWIASTDYRNEMVISDTRLQGVSDTYRRIRNTIRFLLGNVHDFDSASRVKENELTEIDRFMEIKTQNLQKELIEDYQNYQFHLAFNKIHNFCSNDLGGFYLDILKDRLYTCGKESLARRSSQTTLFQILEALVRWIAPILSFTAEEAWRLYHSDLESVHLSEWFEDWVCSSEGSISESEWQQVLKVRSEVNKIIESSRNSGLIGSALEAEIELFCSKDLESILRKFSEELRFVFITSEAKVLKENGEGEETEIEGLKIKISKTQEGKCERCWHSRPEVGSIKDHPTLCNRCLENIDGKGEVRLFA
jgi:isoleucyl-tRNA synthetase